MPYSSIFTAVDEDNIGATVGLFKITGAIQTKSKMAIINYWAVERKFLKNQTKNALFL